MSMSDPCVAMALSGTRSKAPSRSTTVRGKGMRLYRLGTMGAGGSEAAELSANSHPSDSARGSHPSRARRRPARTGETIANHRSRVHHGPRDFYTDAGSRCDDRAGGGAGGSGCGRKDMGVMDEQ